MGVGGFYTVIRHKTASEASCRSGRRKVFFLFFLFLFFLSKYRPNSEINIVDSCMTTDFTKTCFLAGNDDYMQLIFYDTSFLDVNSDNIAKISHVVMQVNSYLLYLQESLLNLENEYLTFTNVQDAIFSKISDILEEHSSKLILLNIVNSTTREEFFSFAIFGSSKSIIAEFLLHSIDDAVCIFTYGRDLTNGLNRLRCLSIT
jgi:hypothetical protein